MANLIIILISIILVAFIAIVGLLYVGPALFGDSVQTMATTLIEQAKQVHAGLMMYGLDHNGMGFSDFSEATAISSGKYFGLGKNIPVPILQVGGYGTGTSPLIMGVGGRGKGSVEFNIGASFCGPIGNDHVEVFRGHCRTSDGIDIVGYTIEYGGSSCGVSGAVDFTQVSSLSTTTAQICTAINKMTGIPAGTTLGASGIPVLSGTVEACDGLTYYPGKYNFCFTHNSGLGSGPSFYNVVSYVYAP